MANTLVLAGDVVPFLIMDRYRDFFQYLSDHFETTYWLPGNHEYYHADIAERSGELYEKVLNNVILVNNISVVKENTRLVFSTLWSHISPYNQFYVERNLNDFYQIRNKQYRLSSNHYNDMHADCLAFIEKEVQTAQEENLAVFTHHCPTLFHYPEKYKGDALNEAFATELGPWIESTRIDSWVYGHHHVNTPDFYLGKARLATNQLGHVSHKENDAFCDKMYLEL